MYFLAFLLALPTAHSACPADSEALRADLEAASQAYAAWEWGAFDERVAAVREDLGCLSEVVTGDGALQVHRLFVLVGARTQDAELVQDAFGGMLAVNPDYEPSLSLAASGSMLRGAYEAAAATAPGSGEPLPEGTWFVDGQPDATRVPTHRAALLQRRGGDGTCCDAWYVRGGELPEEVAVLAGGEDEAAAAEAGGEGEREELDSGVGESESGDDSEAGNAVAETEPAAPTADPVLADLSAQPVSGEGRAPHASRRLLLGGSAMLVAAAAGIGFGEWKQQEMLEAEDESTAQSLYTVGLATTLGGAALGLAGGGLVIGAVVRGEW